MACSFKGVFFDMDDTLYDHLGPLRDSLQEVLSLQGDYAYFDKIYHRFRYYTDVLSANLKGTFAEHNTELIEDVRLQRFRSTLADFGLSITKSQAQALQDDYIGRQFAIEMFEGARELLERLIADGLIVGIITNGLETHQRKKIIAMHLDKLIPEERIFISGAVGLDKPDPRLFAYVNEQTEVPASDCIYIGDSWRNDVMGTKAAGWKMIWFNHRHVKPETDHRPAYIAQDYTDLHRILLGL